MLAVAMACPSFSCSSSLPANACIRRLNSTSFEISSNPCEEGYQCSAIYAYAATVFGQNSLAPFYRCERINGYVPTLDPSWKSTLCPVKEPGKRFKAGVPVVQCTSSSDCMLKDGTYAECWCAYRSDDKGLCAPDLSNEDVYGGYWKACGQSNTIKDADVYQYWNYFSKYWVYLQSDLPCSDIFHEEQVLQKFRENLQGK